MHWMRLRWWTNWEGRGRVVSKQGFNKGSKLHLSNSSHILIIRPIRQAYYIDWTIDSLSYSSSPT